MKDVPTSVDFPSPRPGAVLSFSPPSLVVAPAAVLPEQFFSFPRWPIKGQAALMYAVLEDAFNCFLKQFVDNGVRAQSLAREAEEWFFSTDDSWPFSFSNVCNVLGINPEYVRKGLRQWRQRRPARIRRLKGQRVYQSPRFGTVPRKRCRGKVGETVEKGEGRPPPQ